MPGFPDGRTPRHSGRSPTAPGPPGSPREPVPLAPLVPIGRRHRQPLGEQRLFPPRRGSGGRAGSVPFVPIAFTRNPMAGDPVARPGRARGADRTGGLREWAELRNHLPSSRPDGGLWNVNWNDRRRIASPRNVTRRQLTPRIRPRPAMA